MREERWRVRTGPRAGTRLLLYLGLWEAQRKAGSEDPPQGLGASGGFKTVCLEETGLCERRVWRRAAHPVAGGSCSWRSSGAQASQPRRSWGSSLRAQHGPGGLAAVCVRALCQGTAPGELDGERRR